jgi:hypothetical protein
MLDLSPSLRAKRGFHRVGVSLAALLAALTFAIGISLSIEQAKSMHDRFLTLRCADEKLEAYQIRAVSEPWEEYRQSAGPTLEGFKHYRLTSPDGRYVIVAAAGLSDEDVKPHLTQTGLIRIDELGCGESILTVSASDVAAARSSEFSYGRTLAIPAAVAALASAVVAMLAYLLVASVSWVVRGFMRD